MNYVDSILVKGSAQILHEHFLHLFRLRFHYRLANCTELSSKRRVYYIRQTLKTTAMRLPFGHFQPGLFIFFPRISSQFRGDHKWSFDYTI